MVTIDIPGTFANELYGGREFPKKKVSTRIVTPRFLTVSPVDCTDETLDPLMDNLSDPELIKAIRDGNAEVFRRVFDACYESLCQYAFTIVKDFDQAEDVVQSILMRLWERRETLEIRTSVRSYLFRAVYNQCINQLEHVAIKKRFDASVQSNPGHDQLQPDVFPAELEDNIRRAVDNLPQQCRTIFIMSRYEELRYSEIAEKLDISVNTIQNQICKALKILREELKDRGF